MSAPPVRLLETSDVSGAERAALEAGRSHAAVGYDVDAGAARFRASLAGLAAAGAATAAREAARGAGGKALFAKVIAKVLLSVAVGTTFVGVGVVAGITMARRDAHEHAVISLAPPSPPATARAEATAAASAAPLPPAPVAPVASAPEAANAVSPSPLARAAAPKPHAPRSVRSAPASGEPDPSATGVADAVTQSATATTPAPEPALVPQPAPPAQPTASAAQVHPPPEAPRPLGELQGIAMARSLVARDPAAALGVLDRLRKDHPHGYFVEEREALTVLALAGDGQNALAREQASAFLRVFPNGPYSDQVREVLAR